MVKHSLDALQGMDEDDGHGGVQSCTGCVERGCDMIIPNTCTPQGGDGNECMAQGGGGVDRAGVWHVYE